jgi:hypothetical protein
MTRKTKNRKVVPARTTSARERKRLELRKETLRALDPKQLEQIVGGWPRCVATVPP